MGSSTTCVAAGPAIFNLCPRMPLDDQDQDSLRARSEQAIGELAQALLDSQVLENAVAAAFGAREKALEAQQAALAALNLPSAGEVERLERRLRSVSQRLEEVEDELDRLSREMGGLRRQLAADRAEERSLDASDD
jgi:predicted RNase H-like nuclease (RuvC/YqgF family)